MGTSEPRCEPLCKARRSATLVNEFLTETKRGYLLEVTPTEGMIADRCGDKRQ